MVWRNGPLTVYHGTDAQSAAAITRAAAPHPHGVDFAYCAALVDFGLGFYTTTFLHQARNWADDRVRLRPALGPATVIAFELDRDRLGRLEHLVFARESTDFWDLVAHARTGLAPLHARVPAPYDVVYGPVSLWRQTLVIKDCDQISFHTQRALGVLSAVTGATQGLPYFNARRTP